VSTHTADAPPRGVGAVGRIRVLLVHPERLFGEALAAALGGDPALAIVGVETRPQQAVARAREARPDVALLTDAFAVRPVAQCIAEMRAAATALKPLVLATRHDEEVIRACMHAGAIGYTTTDDSVAELGEAIKRAHAGEILLPPHLLADLSRRPSRPPARPPLGPRELEVLQVLATGSTAEEAAGQLLITVHTLRTHLRNALPKLGAHSKLEAIILALQHGLIELPQAPSRGAASDRRGAPRQRQRGPTSRG
jgi:DNA-binding NarL/FixJ family response regulator